MVKFLKIGKNEAQKAQDEEQVREIVEGILKNIEKMGDDGVRKLSKKFDNYNPKTFFFN